MWPLKRLVSEMRELLVLHEGFCTLVHLEGEEECYQRIFVAWDVGSDRS